MNLLCCESPALRVAKKDRTLLLDDRVFENMLKYESRYLPLATYLVDVQTEFTADQRKVLIDWMWEVCDEQHCQEDVFPLAVSYLDRFLSVCHVNTRFLQILGTTCLLIASKLRETESINITVLVSYTDNSVDPGNIMMFEILLLTTLKWEMSGVTGHDFLWYIIKRLDLNTEEAGVSTVVNHARTFVGMCIRDFQFIGFLPSIIAGASIAAALYGLDSEAPQRYDLYEKLNTILKCNMDLLRKCQDQIEEAVEQHKRNYLRQGHPAPRRRAPTAALGRAPQVPEPQEPAPEANHKTE